MNRRPVPILLWDCLYLRIFHLLQHLDEKLLLELRDVVLTRNRQPEDYLETGRYIAIPIPLVKGLFPHPFLHSFVTPLLLQLSLRNYAPSYPAVIQYKLAQMSPYEGIV